ncbi:MAG: acyltransferase family protein [Limisphaerales bacterium]
MNSARQFYISPFQSDVLDLSRWVAAFLVVVEHLRSLMFADYGTQGRSGIMDKLFYFFTGFGHSAVMVFFVMSGFLVGGKVLDRLRQGNFDWQKYGVDRVSRLYAVYVLALLLGGALDYFGYQYFNQIGFYNHKFPGRIAVINHNFHQNLTVPVFAVNFAMCQTILGPVFGSNGPLWSLANEFWYYVTGPLAFALIFQKKVGFRVFGTIGLAIIIWFLPTPILIYSLVWLLGAMLYFMNGRVLVPFWISLILFAVSFSVARLQWLTIPYLADFLIGISFALLINSAAGASRRLPGHNRSRTAAGFSYSVYLCHFPFLVFVLSLLFQENWIGFRKQPTLKLAMVFLFILLMTYVWCFLISLVTERQTSRIRAWLKPMPSAVAT